ncbi:hypothetical protein F511_19604 [Dorcoceras hygrometricum]|uniref:Uncharacterized protein n=1 Tax=Dorcoceras hygrometricum TaxID=472368 RepID=A0A2Z7BNA9_9LAMI|nr:hypothetical protein F511_19604 [Dorcoceras hygrometricum]
MSASGESSTTMHRLLHASGSHPIPPPNDPKKTWSSFEISDPILRIFSQTFVLCFSNPRSLFTVAFIRQFPSFSVAVLLVRGRFGLLSRSSSILYHSWRLLLARARLRSYCLGRVFAVSRYLRISVVVQLSRTFVVVIITQKYKLERSVLMQRLVPAFGGIPVMFKPVVWLSSFWLRTSRRLCVIVLVSAKESRRGVSDQLLGLCDVVYVIQVSPLVVEMAQLVVPRELTPKMISLNDAVQHSRSEISTDHSTQITISNTVSSTKAQLTLLSSGHADHLRLHSSATAHSPQASAYHPAQIA